MEEVLFILLWCALAAITKGGGDNPDGSDEEEDKFTEESCNSDDSRCSSATSESSLGDEGRECLIQ
eukprot:444277-Pyramimonas_sp.AAC.1